MRALFANIWPMHILLAQLFGYFSVETIRLFQLGMVVVHIILPQKVTIFRQICILLISMETGKLILIIFTGSGIIMAMEMILTMVPKSSSDAYSVPVVQMFQIGRQSY